MNQFEQQSAAKLRETAEALSRDPKLIDLCRHASRDRGLRARILSDPIELLRSREMDIPPELTIEFFEPPSRDLPISDWVPFILESQTMRAGSTNSAFRILCCLAILIAMMAGCEPPVITLPAAETPILETILDIDNNVLAPFHPTTDDSNIFEIAPGKRLELRLRAIWPSDIQVRIEGQNLAEVKDSASHPELDSFGYYRISETRPIDAIDPRFFWRV